MSRQKTAGPTFLVFLGLMLLCSLVLTVLPRILNPGRVERLALTAAPEWVDVQLIHVDGTSRRGEKLEDLRNIVIHYVANPGSTALQNRNWYANPDSEVSSHFLVGLDGEVIQCLPLDEISSASNHRNSDTISIEVCHPDESGAFTSESYASLVRLTAWLLDTTGLTPSDVIRHYDITGKDCPRYFVRNEDRWQAFLIDLAEALEADYSE